MIDKNSDNGKYIQSKLSTVDRSDFRRKKHFYPQWIEVILEEKSTSLIDRRTGVYFKICYESASCTFVNEDGLQWVYNENGVTVTDSNKELEVQKGQWITSGGKDFVIRTFTSDEVLLRARDYFFPLVLKGKMIETGEIFLN